MSIEAVLKGEQSWHIQHCDVFDGLKMLPDNSIDVVVSSPPYFALRTYLDEFHPLKKKEIGSEPTPEAFIDTMVKVYQEVKRVLKPHGINWVNLGDTYAHGQEKRKEGERLNIPHRVAEALSADGWYWRDTAIWNKLGPMPETLRGWRWERCMRKKKGNTVHEKKPVPEQVRSGLSFGSAKHMAEWEECPGCKKCDVWKGYVLRNGSWRCTNQHEYIFMFSKSDEYFAEGEGAKERAIHKIKSRPAEDQKRNMRNVWSFSSEPNKIKHFAAFPKELVRRCLLPSTSEKGNCSVCGMPILPVVQYERVPTRKGDASKYKEVDPKNPVNYDFGRHVSVTKIIDWKPMCNCSRMIKDVTTKPAIVLDPFGGTGTTVVVARKLHLRAISFELNEKHVEAAYKRLKADMPLFN